MYKGNAEPVIYIMKVGTFRSNKDKRKGIPLQGNI